MSSRIPTRARAATQAPDRDRGAKPSALLERYAGSYAHPAYGPATVTLVGGALRWKWSGFASELSHHAGETLRVTSGPLAGQLVEFRVRGGTPDELRAVGTVFDRAE